MSGAGLHERREAITHALKGGDSLLHVGKFGFRSALYAPHVALAGESQKLTDFLERKSEPNEWVERTEWHRVSLFGRLAEVAQQYLKKGSKVYIEGSIRTRKWQDKEGKDRYSTEIVGNELLMLDGKPQGARQSEDAPAQTGNTNRPDEFGDEIPF